MFWRCFNIIQRCFDVISTSTTDAVSMLCNIGNSTSDFVLFPMSDQRYFNVDPQHWIKVNQTLKFGWVITDKWDLAHTLPTFINAWYLRSSKILIIKKWLPFNFTKMFQGRYFVVGELKNFKLLSAIFFNSGFQKIVFSSLLLFSCSCY